MDEESDERTNEAGDEGITMDASIASAIGDEDDDERAADDECAADDGLGNANNVIFDSTAARAANSGPLEPPPPKFALHQRVHAKDDSTGLLYPAIIRRIMWGPKSTRVSMALLGSDSAASLLEGMERCSEVSKKAARDGGDDEPTGEEEGEGEDDEDLRRFDRRRNAHHYYVHYFGWKVKWDRWVEEKLVHPDSPSTTTLATRLQKEYNFKYKPKRKGQKMSVAQVSMWMVRMAEIEAEHFGAKKDRANASGSAGNDDKDAEMGEVKEQPEITDRKTKVGDERTASVVACASADTGGTNGGCVSNTNDDAARRANCGDDQVLESIGEGAPPNETKSKEGGRETPVSGNKRRLALTKQSLERHASLHALGLRPKRRRVHAERLLLPFTLKKTLVEEWEILTGDEDRGCGGMVHKLPCKVTVRNALDKYLERKLSMYRGAGDDNKGIRKGEKRLKAMEESATAGGDGNENNGNENEDAADGSNDNDSYARDDGPTERELEWIKMVEGVAAFFDEALPVHLLIRQERSQYECLRKNTAAHKREKKRREGSMKEEKDGIKEKDDGPSPSAAVKTSEADVDTPADGDERGGDVTNALHTGAIEGEESSTDRKNQDSRDAPAPRLSIIAAATPEHETSSSLMPSPPPLPERPSEIYGCEHLLRLLVRLPSVVASAPGILESEARRIFSKLGDLVRFLQKHQSELFATSYRRLSDEEARESRRRYRTAQQRRISGAGTATEEAGAEESS